MIANELSEIRRAADAADAFCAEHALSEREANAIGVALDEILSNVIRHGFPDAGRHEISVGLDCSGGEITIEIEDDGAPFDPTQVSAPVLAGSLAERRIGGLGLVFVRALTDSVEYRRIGGRNRLVLRRRVRAGEAAMPVQTPFRVAETALGAGLLVTVEGRLDSAAAGTLRDRLLGSVRAGHMRLAVDLGRVPHVGSAGIWALLAAEYLATACGGGLAVFGSNREVRQLFERTGIVGALRVCETRDEALAALRPAAAQ